MCNAILKLRKFPKCAEPIHGSTISLPSRITANECMVVFFDTCTSIQWDRSDGVLSSDEFLFGSHVHHFRGHRLDQGSIGSFSEVSEFYCWSLVYSHATDSVNIYACIKTEGEKIDIYLPIIYKPLPKTTRVPHVSTLKVTHG